MGWPAPKKAEERFDNMYIPVTESGCWLWLGYVKINGYAQFSVEGKSVYAHRYSYERFVGKIQDGLQIDHLCRVRCCVNPAHLEQVTNHENMRRGIAWLVAGKYQLAKTHCPRGHEYSGSNLYTKKHKDGHPDRRCRACIKIYDASVYPVKKQQRNERNKAKRLK